MSDIVARIIRRLERDRDLPIRARVGTALEYVASRATARLYLRACNHVGGLARTIGRPRVANEGSIEIGPGLILNSTFARCELLTGPAGCIEIGRDVAINFGTVISAARRVQIGAGVRIGPYSILADSEHGEAGAGGHSDAGADIEVGDEAWLATRVTLLPGARVGPRSVITAGSIVSGVIPPDVVAGGNPARVLRSARGGTGTTPSDAVGRENGAARSATSYAPAEAPPSLRGVILSDFTAGELAARLQDPSEEPVVEIVASPYDQVTQQLLEANGAERMDVAIVWTRPEGASKAFQRVLQHEKVEERELVEDVDVFCAVLERGSARYRTIVVPSWTLAPEHRGLGMLDARPGGAAWAMGVLNHRLMNRLGESRSVFVLNAQRWMDAVSRPGAGAKGWYVGKARYRGDVMSEAARDIKAALRGIAGSARKLVVVDLDDTLWGGVVGDVGWEQLQLGGHDPIGEALVDFQHGLRRLTRRGILLAIVSKNTEAVALEAMRSHPEMVLRPADFVGWRINWEDKARNVAALAADLKLGLQSVVFIDDNPVERARVKEALPEVLVPDWPEDKLLYPASLAALRCFDTPAVSREDSERTRLYAEEQQREELKRDVGSLDEWLVSLDTRVRAERLASANLTRTTQLLNKTNQMNVSTRRLTEGELRAWAGEGQRAVWAVSVSDRFGDAGLTGILGVERDGDLCRIVDFVLSCRVMGRKVEEAMTHLAVSWAADAGARHVEVLYRPTAKNKPCHDYWITSGFMRDEAQTRFTWDAADPYPVPPCVNFEWTN